MWRQQLFPFNKLSILHRLFSVYVMSDKLYFFYLVYKFLDFKYYFCSFIRVLSGIKFSPMKNFHSIHMEASSIMQRSIYFNSFHSEFLYFFCHHLKHLLFVKLFSLSFCINGLQFSFYTHWFNFFIIGFSISWVDILYY